VRKGGEERDGGKGGKGGREEREEKGKGGGKGPSPTPEKNPGAATVLKVLTSRPLKSIAGRRAAVSPAALVCCHLCADHISHMSNLSLAESCFLAAFKTA